MLTERNRSVLLRTSTAVLDTKVKSACLPSSLTMRVMPLYYHCQPVPSRGLCIDSSTPIVLCWIARHMPLHSNDCIYNFSSNLPFTFSLHTHVSHTRSHLSWTFFCSTEGVCVRCRAFPHVCGHELFMFYWIGPRYLNENEDWLSICLNRKHRHRYYPNRSWDSVSRFVRIRNMLWLG